ncbi:MAG: asparagine synthase B [Bacteroidota bacterium]|nr:asparagine synthase B [Bacteroidota bacterium]MDP4224948.1 asparagine synthase B [Bacteroidota bacterium]
MCGILAVIGKKDASQVQKLSKRMRHRGPDESGIFVNKKGSVLCHERLSIIDLSTGRQPIQGSDDAWVMHNGEIFNHQAIRDNQLAHHTFRTTCDSEVIVHLYEEYGYDFCNLLDGDFAFVVLDGDKFMVARDPIGVKPLYYGKDAEGNLYFASEMKALADQCTQFEPFPPGYYYTGETGFVKYYNPVWENPNSTKEPIDYVKLREALVEATRKRLMSDVPLGVLLSGGLDSSIISAVTQRLLKGSGQKLHSFSVGLGPDAPDMKFAREVADFIGTEHHDVYFSVEEGIKAIEKIIWHLETYDITTIRASTPMYFLSKAITDMGIKVVLSGEGSDEIFGGYLYFHNAPSDDEFQKECVRRVKLLSTADCLRADKSTMAHGLEVRVPFLDRHFIDVAMGIRPQDKRPDLAKGKPEKYVLRKAFDDQANPYLPDNILWRQKEQFSDGVGYSWIDGIVAYCNQQVSDAEFATAAKRFPHNTPKTKEAFYYRTIFEKFYPEQSAIHSVLKWVPKWQKNDDPSGRVCDNHEHKVGDIQFEKVMQL